MLAWSAVLIYVVVNQRATANRQQQQQQRQKWAKLENSISCARCDWIGIFYFLYFSADIELVDSLFLIINSNMFVCLLWILCFDLFDFSFLLISIRCGAFVIQFPIVMAAHGSSVLYALCTVGRPLAHKFKFLYRNSNCSIWFYLMCSIFRKSIYRWRWEYCRCEI